MEGGIRFPYLIFLSYCPLIMPLLIGLLWSSPQWNETALFIYFDEHGGLFDHVSPPMNVPNPDGKISVVRKCLRKMHFLYDLFL